MKLKFEHPALDEPIMVAGKNEVCPTCSGYGKHERRDIDTSLYVESMIEDGDDEGLERYYRGSCDIICTKCNGKNVVFVPILPDSVQEKIWEWEDAEREHRAEVAAERRAGA
jgi:hypothetical protein